MSFTLTYKSRRQEVWRWYWRAWRERLWMFHLAVFAVVTSSAFVSIHKEGAALIEAIKTAPVWGLLSVVWMPLFPMLMFKPTVRTLIVEDDGVVTTIGKVSGKRPWKEIRSVSDEGDYIALVVRNGNAFLVPSRAFKTTAERQQFAAYAIAHTIAAGNGRGG